MQHDVMVSAVHPVLGRLYWVYESGADCNAPDYYGITDCRSSAMLLPHYWRQHDYLCWRHRSHIYSVFGSNDHSTDYTVTEDDSGELHQEMSGLLGRLQARSGQSVEEFRLWLSAPTGQTLLSWSWCGRCLRWMTRRLHWLCDPAPAVHVIRARQT